MRKAIAFYTTTYCTQILGVMLLVRCSISCPMHSGQESSCSI